MDQSVHSLRPFALYNTSIISDHLLVAKAYENISKFK
jgi:hypothetical protein